MTSSRRRQGGSTTTDRLSRHAGSNDAEAACIQTKVKARYAALVVGIVDLPDSMLQVVARDCRLRRKWLAESCPRALSRRV